MRVVRFVRPFVAIFRPVVDQQQHARIGNAIGEQIEQGLDLGIDPVKVFEDQNNRMLQRLAQNDPLYYLERATTSDLRIHLCKRVRVLLDPKQPK